MAEKETLWLTVPWEVLAGAANCATREEAAASAADLVRRDKTPRAVICVAQTIAADPQPALLVTEFAWPNPAEAVA